MICEGNVVFRRVLKSEGITQNREAVEMYRLGQSGIEMAQSRDGWQRHREAMVCRGDDL